MKDEIIQVHILSSIHHHKGRILYSLFPDKILSVRNKRVKERLNLIQLGTVVHVDDGISRLCFEKRGVLNFIMPTCLFRVQEDACMFHVSLVTTFMHLLVWFLLLLLLLLLYYFVRCGLFESHVFHWKAPLLNDKC